MKEGQTVSINYGKGMSETASIYLLGENSVILHIDVPPDEPTARSLFVTKAELKSGFYYDRDDRKVELTIQ